MEIIKIFNPDSFLHLGLGGGLLFIFIIIVIATYKIITQIINTITSKALPIFQDLVNELKISNRNVAEFIIKTDIQNKKVTEYMEKIENMLIRMHERNDECVKDIAVIKNELNIKCKKPD